MSARLNPFSSNEKNGPPNKRQKKEIVDITSESDNDSDLEYMYRKPPILDIITQTTQNNVAKHQPKIDNLFKHMEKANYQSALQTFIDGRNYIDIAIKETKLNQYRKTVITTCDPTHQGRLSHQLAFRYVLFVIFYHF